jgi:hypothetical protein
MTNYVYVIGPDHGFPIKIGVAAKPFVRLMDIQVSHWELMVIHGLFSVESRGKAFRLEKICHKRLAESAIRGEWFNLFAEDAIGVVTELAREMGGRRIKDYKRLMDNVEFVEKLENMGYA